MPSPVPLRQHVELVELQRSRGCRPDSHAAKPTSSPRRLGQRDAAVRLRDERRERRACIAAREHVVDLRVA